MSDIKLKIKHPEWLEHSAIDKTMNLIRTGKCPECIAGWMLVVPLKHALRAIYGSNLKAAWHLLMDAIGDAIVMYKLKILYKLKLEDGEYQDEK